MADQHRAVYEAIRAQDPAEAQAAFRRHVEYLDETRRKALEDRSSAEVIVATLPDVSHSAADRIDG